MYSLNPILFIPACLRRLCRAMACPQPVFANIAEGTHAGHVTRTLGSDIATRHLLVKPGASTGLVVPSNASDSPLGIVTDEGVTGDVVNVALLGSAGSSLLAAAGASITEGDFLVSNASGKAIPLPATPGTYYIVGRALSTASSGSLVEMDPIPAIPRVVS